MESGACARQSPGDREVQAAMPMSQPGVQKISSACLPRACSAAGGVAQRFEVEMRRSARRAQLFAASGGEVAQVCACRRRRCVTGGRAPPVLVECGQTAHARGSAGGCQPVRKIEWPPPAVWQGGSGGMGCFTTAGALSAERAAPRAAAVSAAATTVRCPESAKGCSMSRRQMALSPSLL